MASESHFWSFLHGFQFYSKPLYKENLANFFQSLVVIFGGKNLFLSCLQLFRGHFIGETLSDFSKNIRLADMASSHGKNLFNIKKLDGTNFPF